MFYVPTNEEIEEDLKDINFKIATRKHLDSNPFSYLETIGFKGIEEEYVLKSVHPILKSEIIIHNLVNNDPLTAAHVFSSKNENENGKHYLLMERIQFEPLYLRSVRGSVHLYHTIAEKLANFHLNNNNVTKLKNMGIKEYGMKKYTEIIANLGARVRKLSVSINHEYLLKEELVEKFSKYIGSVNEMLDLVHNTKLTLVHGDCDTGNLIINTKDNDIYAIDYGLAHIDVPVIDIAHLLSATEMSISIRRDIFETYFDIAGNLFPSSMSLQDVRNAGKVLHMLYFLDWYLLTTEMNIVAKNYFLEQIHNRVSLLTDLLSRPNV